MQCHSQAPSLTYSTSNGERWRYSKTSNGEREEVLKNQQERERGGTQNAATEREEVLKNQQEREEEVFKIQQERERGGTQKPARGMADDDTERMKERERESG